MYILSRRYQPDLPNLSEVFNEQELVEVLHGPYNAAIRIFDDLSDRLADGSHYPGWGEFNLNIFNHPEANWIDSFLCRAGLTDEDVIRSVRKSFQAGTKDDQTYIVQIFRDLVRIRLRELPPPIRERYHVFLTLAKRVMEGSYIYFMEQSGSTVASI